MRFMKNALMLALLLLPSMVNAQIVISEIMYDFPGTEGSGDHDWIEIFNASAVSVDVSGYRFVEAGVNHTLKLEQGTAVIPSGGYAVIANSPATFLADYSAYAGTLFDSAFNLSGSGEPVGMRDLALADSDPLFTYAPADSASNNGDSLHRSSATVQLFSAKTPTPGAGTLSASAASEDTDTETQPAATTTDTATTTQAQQAEDTQSTVPVSSYVPPPVPQLFADGGDDRVVIVGADVEFYGRAYNRKQEPLENLVRFAWNFGDGQTAEGDAVIHRFQYPGRYAVMLTIAKHRDAVSDQIVVTAEPARLAFSVNADGSVSIENRSGHDLDISRWIVKSFSREFFLPEETRILSGVALRLSGSTLGFPVGPQTELLYPNGVKAFTAGESASAVEPAVERTQISPVSATAFTQQIQRRVADPEPKAASFQISIPVAEAEIAKTADDAFDADEQRAATSSLHAAAAAAGGAYWWLGAVALASVAALLIVVGKRSQEREWTVIEEND